MFRLKILFFLIILLSCGCQRQIFVDNGQQIAPQEEKHLWSQMNEGPYRDKISFASSTDLFNWQESNIIIAEHASVPGAALRDKIIYLYFVDVSVDGIPEQIGLMKSDDVGKNWSEKEIITITGVEEKTPVDPSPYILPDGRIRLYYLDINTNKKGPAEQEIRNIYSAISEDGVNFIEEEGIRLSEPGIFDPEVIYDEKQFLLYVGNFAGNEVLVSTSSDGLNFNKTQLAYSGSAIPDVIYWNNEYYLYTAGIDIATSKNGLSFQKSPYSFHSNLSKITADPAIIQLADDSYIMFFKFK